MSITEVHSQFSRKKERILRNLAVPPSEYNDASPKGSVDEKIRQLVTTINAYDGCVTTSSCSGRISVFLEGGGHLSQDNRLVETNTRKTASDGGKGGGRWLFTSHSKLPMPKDGPDGGSTRSLLQLLNLQETSRDQCHVTGRKTYLHFKFEPMILHILTSDTGSARKVLSAAQQAGFRESGATSLPRSEPGHEKCSTDRQKHDSTVVVAVRSTGMAFDNIIGYWSECNYQQNSEIHLVVSEEHLEMLVDIANDRFLLNEQRQSRFESLIAQAFSERIIFNTSRKSVDKVHEAATQQRQRKELEGVKRQAALQESNMDDNDRASSPEDIEDKLQETIDIVES